VRRLRPLLWPGALLIAGLTASWGAETAVARFENYGLYGFMRPVADLLLILGGVWLAAAAVRMQRGKRSGR